MFFISDLELKTELNSKYSHIRIIL